MTEATFLSSVQKATAMDKINSAIFVGESGVGKTILAASATLIEDYGPVLIVDIEGSAAGVGRLYPDVDIVSADSHAKLEFIKRELLENEHPYKTVIFDTLNVAQNRAEAFFRLKPENANNKFGVWGDLNIWTVDFVRSMHHAPFMAIFIAHPQTDKDENTGRMVTSLKIKGGAKSEVPTVVDLIGFMDYVEDAEGNPARALRVGRSTSVVTKNRFGLDSTIFGAPGSSGPTMLDIQQEILRASAE